MLDPVLLVLGGAALGVVFGFFLRGALSAPHIEVGPAVVEPPPRAPYPVVHRGCPHGTDCFMPAACVARGQCGGKPVTFAWPPAPDTLYGGYNADPERPHL